MARLSREMAHPAPDLKQQLAGSAPRRWVAFGPQGPRLNEPEIRRDVALDGCYVLHTNSPGTDLDLAVAYLRFQDRAREVVRRTALVPPALHPGVWPAMVLVHAAEQRTGRSWSDIVNRLADVHQVTVAAGPPLITRLDDDQRALLRSSGMQLP